MSTTNQTDALVLAIREAFKSHRTSLAAVTVSIRKAIEHADAHGNVSPLQLCHRLASSEADKSAIVTVACYHGRVVFRDGKFCMSRDKSKVTFFDEWHSTNFRKTAEAINTARGEGKTKPEFDAAKRFEAYLAMCATHGVGKAKLMKLVAKLVAEYAPDQTPNGKPVADKALAS